MEKIIEFGPIQELINDPSVSEIMINGPKKVFAEKNGKKISTGISFANEEEVIKLIANIYAARGKRIDEDIPYADVCTEDGTRINAVLSPVSRFGIAVTLRKFAADINTLDDLVRLGTLNKKAAEFLSACIRGKVNIVFSGGTAVGKTTLLQILSRYFNPDERVVTIEDAAELRLAQENVVSLETKTPDREGKGGVFLRDLIRNALRMAPDRLVIGEIRGSEAIDMLQAMATGHSGTIGIVHGNSPRDVIARIETMVLMSGIQLPLWEVRKLIASTINLVVHLERTESGSRKITQITEIRGLEKEEVLFNDLFTMRQEKGPDGEISAGLKPCIRYYPLFFQKLQKMNLLSDKIFVNE